VPDIIERWACGKKSCPNANGFCYIVDDVHLKVMPRHMRSWSIFINEDTADLETPPEALMKTFTPAKSGTKNPFRIADSKTLLKDATPQTPAYLPSQQFFPLPFTFNPYNGMQQYPQPLLQPSQSAVMSETHPQSSSYRSSPLRSSPLPCEGDADKLVEYINWVTKIHPTKADQLAACLETLRSQDIVFETVDDITNDLWEAWGISHGIKLLLKSHLKKWERAKAKGRV
jgi:hypothetical protein